MDQPPPVVPYAPPPKSDGKAIASMVLGIVGLFAWFCPILGLPITITGLVLGIKSLNSNSRGMAIAGVVMCSLGLFASVVNAGIGAYMGATGRHPLLNRIQNTGS